MTMEPPQYQQPLLGLQPLKIGEYFRSAHESKVMVDFNTGVDTLMKAIHKQSNGQLGSGDIKNEQVRRPAYQPGMEAYKTRTPIPSP